ncbi:MAG: methyltransferase, partial [Verrucomicrobiota bacterium]
LPDILTGRRQATEILFPGGSMDRVAGIYTGDPTADYFHQRLTDRVLADVRAAGKPLRILEVGAGTGGTSAHLLKALEPHADSVRYTYTDVSKQFLMHGEETFVSRYPFVEIRLLDIEQAPQALQGEFDILVAANVLHATRHIATTLKNAGMLLKPGGLIVLNELAEVSPFLTLTFGLLDGWWLFEDEAIRIPGSPGLTPAAWKRALEEQGFSAVEFPEEQAHDRGQQIVAARRGASVTAVPAGHVETALLRELSRCIKIEESRLDTHTTFSDYGVDSIIMLGFVDGVNEALGIDLSPSDLFNHTTTERLSDFIAERYAGGLKTVPVIEKPPAVEVDLRGVAVIGMAGQFPGAHDVHGFW